MYSSDLDLEYFRFIYKLLSYDSSHPWVYGGEYLAFAKDVTRTIQAWQKLHIQPHFVFDGEL